MIGWRLFPVQEKLLSITLLGALAGLFSGAVVLLFRFTIDVGQGILLPVGRVGNYEALTPSVRLALPVAGALLLALFLHWLPRPTRQVGVVHVLDRFWSPTQTASLPFGNALTQFATGALAIVSGHSVDREGPGVHLGAAAASLLGQRFAVAQEELRTLVACGTAASIAAAFNTPLAGVVFVIEVVRVRYTVPRFMPVLLAAVVGGVIAQACYGLRPAFDVLPVKLASLSELPSLALFGVIIGVIAESSWRYVSGLRNTPSSGRFCRQSRWRGRSQGRLPYGYRRSWAWVTIPWIRSSGLSLAWDRCWLSLHVSS